jgi:hypothetical protein
MPADQRQVLDDSEAELRDHAAGKGHARRQDL